MLVGLFGLGMYNIEDRLRYRGKILGCLVRRGYVCFANLQLVDCCHTNSHVKATVYFFDKLD